MFQSAALELQSAPIATIASALAIVGAVATVAFATWTFLSGRKVAAASDADVVPDFRAVLICIASMPVIASGFALVASYGVRHLGFIPAFILALLLAAGAVSVTALLSGVILGPWLRGMYHERTINKVKHGYYGPLSYTEYSASVGYIFGWLTYAVFLLFLVEPTYMRLNGPPRPEGEISFPFAIYGCIMIFAPSAAIVAGMFGMWASFLFKSQAKTF